MPEFALVENSVPRSLSPTEAVFVPAGGGQPDRNVPVGALASYTEAERNAIGVYTVGQDTTPVPSSKKVTGRELRYVAEPAPGTVKWYDVLVDLPLDERKTTMRQSVDRKRRMQTELGYSHDFGPAMGGVHELDTSEETETSWIHYRNNCQEQIDAGSGTAVMPLPIRDKNDVDLFVRANQGMACMVGMRDREGSMIAYSRTLKDQIRAATSHTQLDAIDINAGWPA